MARELTFRRAGAADADCLSRLAIRSKAHWGYSTEFMQACHAELTVTPEFLQDREMYFEVALDGRQIAGFYAFEDLSAAGIELGALYVEPSHIGKGIGRQLLERAKAQASARGAGILVIPADPHALAFYRAAGAVAVGEQESGSIPGRMLPLLEIRLPGKEDEPPAHQA